MDNFYSRYPVSSGGVPIYANVGAFPISATTGSLAVDASTGNLFEFNGISWVMIAGPNGSFDVLIPDGTESAPGLAFLSETNTGLYKIASHDVAFSVNGKRALEMKYIDANNTIFSFNSSIGATATNPLSCGATINSPAFFNYSNLSAGTSSATVFYIGNGPDGGNGVTIENTSYTIAGYLNGGAALFASPNLTQLNIGSERSDGLIKFNVGGRTLATERMVLSSTALTMGDGVQSLIIDGSSSAPGWAFKNETNSGFFRLGANDIAASCGGIHFMEVIKNEGPLCNVAFGPPGTISAFSDTPYIFSNSYGEIQTSVFVNTSEAILSGTAIAVANGTSSNFTTLENWAWNTVDTYLGGGSALFASPNQTQLIIGSENASGFIGFTTGGRILSTERVRLTTASLTINKGTNLVLSGATSGALTINAAAVTTSYAITMPAAQGAANTFLKNDGAGNLTWTVTGASGANTFLSNLTSPTAINQDLIFDTGAAANLKTKDDITQTTQNLTISSGSSVGGSSFSSGTVIVSSGPGDTGSGDTVIATGQGGVGNSGALTIVTGDSPGAGGSAGNIIIAPGTGFSGGPASLRFNNVGEGTAGDVWTSVDTSGGGAWRTPATNNKELFTLSGTDITNQYVDLAHVAKTNSIDFLVKGGGVQIEGASYDYSVSYTGGAGGNTRITFLNDLATGGLSALVAGDIVVAKYEY